MQSIFNPVIVLLFLSILFSSTNAHLRFPDSAPEGLGVHNKAKNFAAGAGVAPASADAPKPEALKLNPQQSGFNFNLTNKLPLASSTVTRLSTPPAACSAYVGEGDKAECKATMEAYSITFDDCGDSWTICRCSDAQMTMETVVNRFGRVPVGLRRYVAMVFVMGDATPHAYSLTTGDLHFFNDCQMETWIHESAHAFDYASGSPVSGTKEWLSALETDTCAPDDYALNNRIEDFAQVTVLKVYALAHGGKLPPGFSADCMRKQLDFMDELPLYNAGSLFGNTCNLDLDWKFDLNMGAKKTTAPSNPKSKTFPLPGLDSPVVNVGADPAATSDSPTPSSTRFVYRPSSLISVGTPDPTAEVPKKKVYNNAGGRSGLPAVGYQLAIVGVMIGWALV